MLNSRYPLACATHSWLPRVSHAYSEVTRAICRVPSAQFSQTPWYALPDHLCRFRVRSLLELFPGTTSLPGQSNKPRQLTSSVTSSWCRNIYLLPIDYAFQPRLRGRLTLRRLALRRNPWSFGGSVSHTPIVTHVSILTSDTSSRPHGRPSPAYGTLRYRLQ